jgi:DNA-binding protein H-NS
MNLNEMSLKELKDMRAAVEKAIATYEDRKRREALAEVEEFIRSKGLTMADVAQATPSRKRTVSAAKYANPANPADTWTGRGRKPRWYVEAIAAGRSPDDMAI